jgi:predicted metal-dependent hydrolase
MPARSRSGRRDGCGILRLVQLDLPFVALDSMAPTSESALAPTRVRTIAPTGDGAIVPESARRIAPTSDSVIAPTSVSRIAPTVDSAIAPTSDSAIAPVYFVRHRRARRYLLRVDHDGRVRVTIPRGGSKREADAFARRHVDWVARQRARLTPSAFGLEEKRERREQARAELPGRLRELADQFGIPVARVSIRNQRTRWGSCGRDGHITLNWRLVLMPPEVRDYVLIHELMHVRRLDHSPAFWKLVAAACPGYREARQWLRLHGPALR